MKKLYLFLLVILASYYYSQCVSIEIPRASWTVHSFDTEEANGEGPNNGRAVHSIDSNINTFWHTRWQNYTPTFPHFIAFDMGQVYPVDGISVTSRNDTGNNKPKSYEVYLSSNGTDWDPVQSKGEFIFANPTASGQTSEISFGAVNARYFKIVFLSSYSDGNHIAIAEIKATQISGSGCGATGQNNQVLLFPEIEKKYTTDPPFQLNATTNSGLPISYNVVSGPATISGNTVTLTGTGGTVSIKASQTGNSSYYPVEVTRTFQVVDLQTVSPVIISRLTEDKPVQMPQLMPYILYSRATIDESNVLSISDIQYFANGEPISSQKQGEVYRGIWTPTHFGNHEIEIRATGSNGAVTSKFYNIVVTNAVVTQTAQTLNQAVIDFGTIGSQWYYGTYKMPQSVGAYDKIMATYNVTCPGVPGGCDDWDRLGWIQIKNPAGQWTEIFRYITPYGVPCNHQIDLTDYESLLQGEVEFRVYIETWGTGGWKMDLNLEYQQGTPAYAYTSVQEAWQGTYNFGDMANLQPVPTINIAAPAYTEAATFRLVTTGHGWGANNTGNAAEFYFATHNLKINGANTFTQYLRTICNPNPDGCTGQQGTWQYSRAGWCPGTIPKPYFYDLTPYIATPFNFTYEFQPSYIDMCHPNNPACVSGQTCSDCNDGYNPHYRVGGYVIYKGNQPLGLLKNNEVNFVPENKIFAYPNANNGLFKLSLQNEMKNPVVQIFDTAGRAVKTYFFKNKTELTTFNFDISTLPSGVYFVQAYNVNENYVTKIIKK